ncbi:MAG: S41 family peptidase [Candidatus Levybacteria bacterium]|nr:S41 family peptidase [Candidatus Levybacteria bacterium]
MKKNLRIIALLIIAGFIGYYIGVNKVKLDWKNYAPHVEVVNKEPPESVSRMDLAPFWTVLSKIEEQYYDKTAIDSQKLLNGAITGLVESLEDPYTVYLPPKQNDNFKQGLAGKFEGIGAELGMRGKQIIVVAPLDGSPAQKAGIKAGDAIMKVNEQLTFGWTLNQAIDKIRGPKGTGVTLAIVHKDEEKLSDIIIVRDTITVKSVVVWTKKIKDISEVNNKKLGNGDARVTYIRLSQFGDNTNQEWIGIASSVALDIKKEGNYKGIILDLRNNPGGYLSDAVFIASEFIPRGTVVIQEDGRGNRNKLNVSRTGLLHDVPLVILINRGSASASEIVAGSMRDHKRATIVGETSFGKGTIQQAEDLGDGAGLHVTVAKWLTPNDTWVHQKGLTPDIEIAVDAKDQSHDAQLEKAIAELL